MRILIDGVSLGGAGVAGAVWAAHGVTAASRHRSPRARRRSATRAAIRVMAAEYSLATLARRQLPRCIRSIRAVAKRASTEQLNTIVTSTSAPAHACWCHSGYGDVAKV